MWSTSQQAGEERIPIVGGENGVVESTDKAARTLDQSCAGHNIPFVLRRKCEGDVRESGGNQCQFVSNRTHYLDLKRRILKWRPFGALYLAAADEYYSNIQCVSLAVTGR